MILPTPAASMYAVEMEVLEGAEAALLNQGRLGETERKKETGFTSSASS